MIRHEWKGDCNIMQTRHPPDSRPERALHLAGAVAPGLGRPSRPDPDEFAAPSELEK